MELALKTREKPANLNLAHELIDDLHDRFDRQEKNHQGEIAFLRERLRYLANLLFAAKCDRVDVSLFNEAELMGELAQAGEEGTEPVPRTGSGKGEKKPRKIIPDGLPTERVIHDLTADQKAAFGDCLQKIGEDVTRELDYTPGKFRVIEHVTIKYATGDAQKPLTQSTKPRSLIPKSVVSPALLSHIIISKYENHLPLYRQEQMFARRGIYLGRDVMASWVIAFGKAVVPLINLLKEYQLEGASLQCDETPYRLLTVDGVKKTKKSYLWVTCRWGLQPIVLYHNGPDRGSGVAKNLMAGFVGYLQVDGYKGYDWVLAPGSQIKRVGCLAHVRRKFVDFLKALKKNERHLHGKALEIRALIKKLYAVEDELRQQPSLDRVAVRKEKARPLFDALEALVASELDAVASEGLYGKALHYARRELPFIKHYLSAADVEIDNNLCENALRPFCLGKKNWLFAQTSDGGEASANIYSLIMTARANGLNAEDYLKSLAENLPACQVVDDYVKLLPFK